MSIHLTQHIKHMKLKNWAYSLFEPSQVLYHKGFIDVRATPAIETSTNHLTPDIIAWANMVTLILDAKSGKPDPDGDFNQAKEYLQIPKEALESYLERPISDVEVVLLYFEENLRDQDAREGLLSNVVLEPKIIIWSFDERAGQIRLFYGNHSNSDLNAVFKARVPVNLIPPRRIFIQPDSPLPLVTRELFLRLLQRAYRHRNKTFSLNIAQEEMREQVYAFKASEERTKLRKAIKTGLREGLCRSINSELWELNLVFRNPESYLRRLNQIIERETLEEFL